ncbi:PREDICTED: uncharacterized protein LOC106117297 isoform X2 [Papilio xuthus]|uniref:Uncharacterized protein LOC106117297 isoform X2 n=1 Tax=Papilio xuthus TaxID=66420 RepID=A0AAJ6Z7W2_PAPXU|nr:PREDICTED: uncharacterized protein LOC106117297 isoform X2 [Papilio xuthus]
MEMENPDSLLRTFKYLHVCRICLGKGQNTLNLFSKTEDAIGILNKILECFQIKLEFKKHLPSFICKKCMEDVTIAWKFREKCINFEKQFAVYNRKVLETNVTLLHSNDELEEIEVKEEIGLDEENVDSTNHNKISDMPEKSHINVSYALYHFIQMVTYKDITEFILETNHLCAQHVANVSHTAPV